MNESSDKIPFHANNTFFLTPITCVWTFMYKFNGYDKIPMPIIKFSRMHFPQPFTNVINSSISSAILPERSHFSK